MILFNIRSFVLCVLLCITAFTTNYAMANLPAEKGVDFVIFSFDRPLQLWALLESTEANITGLNTISVIYRTSHAGFDQAYGEVQQRFPQVRFFRQGPKPKKDFKKLTMAASFSTQSLSSYLMYGVDDIIVTRKTDLTQCTKALEASNAYGFYLRLGQNISYCYMQNIATPPPALIPLSQDQSIFMWNFHKTCRGDWNYPHSVDMTILRKSTLNADLASLSFFHPNSLEHQWSKKAQKADKGLCFAHSHIVNLPLNMVHISGNRYAASYSTKELLEKFQAGLKIDISAFNECNNNSPHMNYPLKFISREAPRSFLSCYTKETIMNHYSPF